MTDAHTIEAEPRPCWIGGRAQAGARTSTVRHPYDGTELAEVAVPGAAQIDAALTAAWDVAKQFSAWPQHLRADALTAVADAIADRAEEIAETITAENGKPLRWAELETDRAVAVVRAAADSTTRNDGELRELDTDTAGGHRLAIVRRRSRGPVLAITPAQHPFGLVAHKVAAALAVGAPVIVKPASTTPLSALLLGEILAGVRLPDGAFSVLPVDGATTATLVTDERLPVLAFTGSAGVASSIMAAAPAKHRMLETTGVGAAILCPDWHSEADLDLAAHRIAGAGNHQAGQSRTAIRHVVVPAAMAEDFVPRLVAAVRALPTGDPHDPVVEVGPLSSERAAERVHAWLGSAVAAGAELLTGGGRDGATVEPTVLRGLPMPVPAGHAPALVVSTVDDTEAAFALADTFGPGLRVGLFTRNFPIALDAAAQIAAVEVITGDVPGYQEDVRATMLGYTRSQTLGLLAST